ncbi:MAG: Stp1/IreP family PP2C-type Ser/Thr phosphatase [Parachlamydiaceae bacterium]
MKAPAPEQTSYSEEILSGMAINQAPYKIVTCGISDVGLVRQNNEDAWKELPNIGFYVLADGMGGHQAGEVAAKEAVETLCRVLKRKFPSIKHASIEDVADLISKAIVHVNKVIYKMGRSSSDLRGMGTTLCCLFFHRDGVIIGHVGDSRIYRLRGRRFDQMTRDHSLLCELIDQGQLNEQQATDFLYKNIITKAVGTEPLVEPTVETKKVLPGDVYLMCSDGLSDLLSDEEMVSILESAPSQESAAKNLVTHAIERGGRDNITVVITKIEGKNASKGISRQ